MAGNVYVDGLWTGPWASVTACNDSTPFVAGQVGKVTSLPTSTSGNLAPRYQYVQRKGSDTASNVAGSIMTWVTATSNVVGIGDTSRPIAGVFLGDDDQTDLTLKGMQSGNYGFIQISGLASCVASSTDTCTTAGLPVVFNTTGQVLVVSTTAITSTYTTTMVGRLVTTTTAQNGPVTVLLEFPSISGNAQ